MATEKRLIDANEVERKIRIAISSWHRDCNSNAPVIARAMEDALQRVIYAPTVDAVEVVRCKDCKFAEDMLPIQNGGGCLMGECTLRKEDDMVYTAFGDDFCSYGERKDNGN